MLPIRYRAGGDDRCCGTQRPSQCGGHVRSRRKPKQSAISLSDIGAVFEQVGGEAVTQRVQRDAFLDPRSIGRFMKQAVKLAAGHRLAGPGAGE